MRTQTPRTRSTANAVTRHTTLPARLQPLRNKCICAWSGIFARLVLVAMLISTTTPAQAARTTKAAATKATKTTEAAEQQQAPVPTTVYRCRQADGQMLYTQHACPAAAADKVMQISDARTQEQARHSGSMQSRNRKLGQRMERERQTWARQAARHHKQALALTLPEQEESEKKAAKRKSASSSSKRASRKSKPDKNDARDPKPLRPADFTARVPGSKASTAKQRKGEDA